jgi:hypothetical protein
MKLLLIPGTGGSLLKFSDTNEVINIAKVVLEGGDGPSTQRLKCAHDVQPHVLEPKPTSVEIKPHGHMSLAYQPFDADMLNKWKVWNYDWRLDIRWSGMLLEEHLKKGGVPKPNDRWHIVTHSQGGLVLLWAARRMREDVFAQYVSSVVFVGVPFFGTVNAAAAMLKGTFFGNSIPPETVRTWPSVYQMLPRWNVRSNAVTPDLLLNGTWSQAGFVPDDGTPLDTRRHIDSSLLARARAWHSAVTPGPHQPSGGLFEPLRKLRFVRIVLGEIPESTGHLLPNFPTVTGPLVVGDTLVPSDVTHSMLPTWVRDAASIRRFPTADHMLLCSDPNVYDWCPP